MRRLNAAATLRHHASISVPYYSFITRTRATLCGFKKILRVMSRYEQMKVSLQNFCADLYNSIICHLDVNLSVITEAT